MHHLDAVMARFALPAVHLVAGQQSRVDQLAEHRVGRGLVREDREQFFPVDRRTRSLGRHQVAEDLAHEVLPVAHALQHRLRVLCQGPGDAANLSVRLACEDLALAVPLLPKPRDGEREQRQRRPRPRDALHDLFDHCLVFEPVADLLSRLHQRPPEGTRREREQRREIGEEGPERRVLLRPHEEVVAQRHHDVHAGVGREPAEKVGEARLHVAGVQREQLLELVHDEQRALVPPPPRRECGCHLIARVGAHEALEGRRVVRQFGHQRPRHGRERPVARRQPQAAPAARGQRDDAGAQERRLARSRRADDGQQRAGLEALPERLHLRLAPEEPGGVLLAEAREPRVRAPLLHIVEPGRAAGRIEHRLEREPEVVRRLEPMLGPLLEASPDDGVHGPRHRWRDSGQRRGRFVQDGADCRGRGVPLERVRTAEQLVEYDAEGEDVRAGVHLPPLRLLRRHVGRGAHQPVRNRRARLGAGEVVGRLCCDLLGEAEVEDLQPPVGRDEQVRRLDVAVDDALAVGRGQPLGRLRRPQDHLALGRRAQRGHVAEVLAFEQFGHDVRRPVVRSDVVDGEDVRVVQRRDGPGLTLEPGPARP